VERHEIEAFLVLAEELHFRRAAERLGLSQGRTSQIVKKLERRFGAPLFERTSRRVSLTPVGRRLRDGIEPAWRQIERGVAEAVAAGRGTTGALRLGFMGPATAEALNRVIDAFHVRHPECAAQILLETEIDDHLAPLRNDTVDVLAALLPVNEPELTVGPVLVREPWVLAVSARHPLARRASASLDELAGQTVLTVENAPDYWIDQHLPPRAATGEPVVRGPSAATFQAALALIAAGRGILPVTAQVGRFYARPDIAYVPITDARDAEFALVWKSSRENARIRAFAELAAGIGTRVTSARTASSCGGSTTTTRD
jgi:DNA-binding transcriptional LysR family regulator